MRKTFIETLTELAAEEPRIIFLTADLGYMAIDSFRERFPNRFYNVGVAEQNLLGIATGLAESGFFPFVYSISTFATLRPYEFIRNGPIMHRLPVRIIGVGAGFEYGLNGLTHYALEDIGILRVQPGITIISPSDFKQARSALRSTWDLPGPIYYRIGKDDQSVVSGLDGKFSMERIQLIRDGEDVLLITSGGIALEVVRAAEFLAEQGVSCAIAVVACLKPAPKDDLSLVMEKYPLAVTIEAHYITGGLGSIVAETITEMNIKCRLIRCGVHEIPKGITGSQQFMNDHFGLSPRAIADNVIQTLK